MQSGRDGTSDAPSCWLFKYLFRISSTPLPPYLSPLYFLSYNKQGMGAGVEKWIVNWGWIFGVGLIIKNNG